MKTKDEVITEQTILEQLREIRDKLSLEMKDMTLEQIKEFLKKKETLHPLVWR
jgi:hypothetical protein